jgi:hypothetical protein
MGRAGLGGRRAAIIGARAVQRLRRG